MEIRSNGSTVKVKLTGRLDRVEKKNGITRIKLQDRGFQFQTSWAKTIEEYFDKVFTELKYKESFQQYYYALLYKSLNSSAKINIGIYPLRSAGKGIEFYEDNFVSNKTFNEFKKRLGSLLGKF
jgi:hypothetical protein